MKFPYSIHIDPIAWIKLNEYAAQALDPKNGGPREIGGLARIQVDKEDKNVFVIDVEMFKQEASVASFAIDADEINKFMLRLMKEGRADEIPSWKSLVHTHPSGMGAQMSGLDITEIKKFASDEDAFSLILSANKNAQSTNMLMHYCAYVPASEFIEARTIIINDIPVEMATTTERNDLVNDSVDAIMKQLSDEVGDGGKKVESKLTKSLHEAINSSIPDVKDYKGLREKISGEVAEHVKEIFPKKFASDSVWKTDDNRAWEYWGDYEEYKKQSDPLDDEIPYYKWKHTFKHDGLSLKQCKDLMLQEFRADLLRIGSAKKYNWSKMMTRMNKELRRIAGVGLFDSITVDSNTLADPNEGQEFVVEDVTDNTYGFSYRVNDEEYFEEELKLVKTFESQPTDTKSQIIQNYMKVIA